MNKQQLAQKIWASANRMRSNIEAGEYKDFILGFIFYKYLSDRELRFLLKNDYDEESLATVTEEDAETVKFVQDNLGYFISYKDLFSTWLKPTKKGDPSFDVANVRDALNAFDRLISPTHKKVFEKIFNTLQTGLSKLGNSSGAQTKAIVGLFDLIKDIPMDGKQGYDVLGFIYEYLIGMFAANAGKKAGEFYTPHEVSLLMSEIVAEHLKDRKEIKIYDPTSGSASLLINIGKSVSKYAASRDNIVYYAQELKANTYNLTRMNLVMRGIKPDNIVTRNGDTLEDDWPIFDEQDRERTYNPLFVDAVVSNPPYSQAWNPEGKLSDVRFSDYGLAPKGKADYAFLLHDLYHLNAGGVMTIVLPHGVLFRGGEEGTIRKNLIEKNRIEAIIGLPPNIFFGTGIPTIIMVLCKNREDDGVLIIDASKGFAKEGKNNKLRACDIKRIADCVAKRESIPKFSRVVTREEIRGNGYNLNIPRYVDSSEEAEHWDVYASMFGGIPVSELEALHEYWEAFPALRNVLFAAKNAAYAEVAAEDIKAAIKGSADVTAFERKYQAAFSDWPERMKAELLSDIDAVDVDKEETILSDDIFVRLQDISLIDKYEAYQLLDNQWGGIAVDLETIQTEGFAATKQVDPHLVIKKSGKDEEEVQDGWEGHVIPFVLIQRTILKEDAEAIRALEDRLASISGEYEFLLDECSEDDKETYRDCFNEEGDAFVPKEIKKVLKELEGDTEAGDIDRIFSRVMEINEQEKKLKKEVKVAKVLLENKTKETIEKLTDEEVRWLLELKWISPLAEELTKLPETVVDKLVKEIETLREKYATTIFAIEKDIQDTQKALAGMMSELEGNEYDMEGLRAFQSLLAGENDGIK